MKVKRYGLLVSLTLVVNSMILAQNLLNNPESVVFDPARDAYLVSNKGDGKIVLLQKDGSQSVFAATQQSIRGLHIVGDTLLAACNAGLVGYRLSDAAKLFTVDISGRQFLNDVISDTSGNIYVSDSGGSKIFKVNRQTLTFSVLTTQISSPNGILFAPEKNQLFVVQWGSNPGIWSVSLMDGSAAKLYSMSAKNLDGITEDVLGNLYVSAWGTGTVYRFARDFSTAPEVVSTGHDGPADIFINKDDHVLAVPNFNGNTVDLVALPTHVAEKNRPVPEHFQLLRNFPNPFGGKTCLYYRSDRSGRAIVRLYDLLGREVLQSQIMVREGEQASPLEVSTLPQGIYFIQVEFNGRIVGKLKGIHTNK